MATQLGDKERVSRKFAIAKILNTAFDMSGMGDTLDAAASLLSALPSLDTPRSHFPITRRQLGEASALIVTTSVVAACGSETRTRLPHKELPLYGGVWDTIDGQDPATITTIPRIFDIVFNAYPANGNSTPVDHIDISLQYPTSLPDPRTHSVPVVARIKGNPYSKIYTVTVDLNNPLPGQKTRVPDGPVVLSFNVWGPDSDNDGDENYDTDSPNVAEFKKRDESVNFAPQGQKNLELKTPLSSEENSPSRKVITTLSQRRKSEAIMNTAA